MATAIADPYLSISALYGCGSRLEERFPAAPIIRFHPSNFLAEGLPRQFAVAGAVGAVGLFPAHDLLHKFEHLHPLGLVVVEGLPGVVQQLLVLPFIPVDRFLALLGADQPLEDVLGKAGLDTQVAGFIPDEVDRLADTMNRMLVRLEQSVDDQRRFVGDASHELRTPLAIVNSSLENLEHEPLGEDESDSRRELGDDDATTLAPMSDRDPSLSLMCGDPASISTLPLPGWKSSFVQSPSSLAAV